MKQPYAIGIGVVTVLVCVGAPMYACHHKDSAPARRARLAAERDVAACFVEGLHHDDPTTSISAHCPDAIEVVFDDDHATTWREALESLHAAETELRTHPERRAVVDAILLAQAKAVRGALASLPTMVEALRIDHADAAAVQLQHAVELFKRNDEPGGIAALRDFDAIVEGELREP